MLAQTWQAGEKKKQKMVSLNKTKRRKLLLNAILDEQAAKLLEDDQDILKNNVVFLCDIKVPAFYMHHYLHKIMYYTI